MFKKGQGRPTSVKEGTRRQRGSEPSSRTIYKCISSLQQKKNHRVQVVKAIEVLCYLQDKKMCVVVVEN